MCVSGGKKRAECERQRGAVDNISGAVAKGFGVGRRRVWGIGERAEGGYRGRGYFDHRLLNLLESGRPYQAGFGFGQVDREEAVDERCCLYLG